MFNGLPNNQELKYQPDLSAATSGREFGGAQLLLDGGPEKWMSASHLNSGGTAIVSETYHGGHLARDSRGPGDRRIARQTNTHATLDVVSVQGCLLPE